MNTRSFKAEKRIESLEKDKDQVAKLSHQVRNFCLIVKAWFGIVYSIYSISVCLKQSPTTQPKTDTFQAAKSFLDCFTSSTGHGLIQIARPDNLFLRILWGVFVFVAIGGCSSLVLQTFDQYFQFGVITTTRIKRETEIKLLAQWRILSIHLT